MKVLVIGAGVLGSLYAARLQEAGEEVTILARGTRLDQIRAQGLQLLDGSSGRRSETHVAVVDRLAPDDAYDLVLVLVRKNQLVGVLPMLAANRHTPNVLFMLNNAAGPDELIAALGRERVLLGFPGAGGVREGGLVRYIIVNGAMQPTTIGELGGRSSPRLLHISAAFRRAGFPVAISRNMDAWLKTHVAVVSPVANALYMAGGDNYRLARTRDGVVLMIRAIREGLSVLRALGVPITPGYWRLLERVPEPLLVALLRRNLASKRAELVMAGHANAARDEMQQLADEFQALARATNVPTPAIDCLYSYLDPAVPAVTDGRAQIPLQWRGLWIALGALGAAAVGWQFLNRRRRRGRPNAAT